MSSIVEFLKPISAFSSKPAPLQLEALAWYLHEIEKKDRISPSDLLQLFDEIHITRPANISTTLARSCAKRPARFLKDARGFRLSAISRDEMNKMVPVRATTARATALLEDLLARFQNPQQKFFLTETLICFRHGAYRAAIVMAWNLAFSHLLDRIYSSHLAAFNSQTGTHNFKKPIAKRTDLSELKESDVIKIARAAKIISGEDQKILNEKLGKRNSAAHPSAIKISIATAEEVIFDLVENVILNSDT